MEGVDSSAVGYATMKVDTEYYRSSFSRGYHFR